LIFRNPGKSSKKNNEIIIMRCTAFLNGNYGALLNKWEADLKKALLRPKRRRKPEDEKNRLKRATDDILNAKPHCISRGAARILGNGSDSCDTTTSNDQMLAKHSHPLSDETWAPHERSSDDSDDIVYTNLPELMDRLDPYVGVGPRGVHAHYITCLNRGLMIVLDTEEGAGVQPFRKLGELVLGNVCHWVLRELAANVLTPLMEHATGNDARPVSAKDCDYAIWMKSIYRTVVKSVSQNVLPQQLGIFVSNGNEAKNVMLRMCKMERLASGRGGSWKFLSAQSMMTQHFLGIRRRSSARGARGSSLHATSPTSAANFTRARRRRTE
jgi:hypothetical protein